jgi:hypothetical protein
VPTAQAVDLARRIADPLDALTGVAAGLGRSTELADRTLHLGGPAEIVTAHVLPALVETVAAGVAVRTRLGLASDLLTELADGRLELVVSTVPARRAACTPSRCATRTSCWSLHRPWRALVDPALLADSPDRRCGPCPWWPTPRTADRPAVVAARPGCPAERSSRRVVPTCARC